MLGKGQLVVMRKQQEEQEMEARTLESNVTDTRRQGLSMEDGALRMKEGFAKSNLIRKIEYKNKIFLKRLKLPIGISSFNVLM